MNRPATPRTDGPIVEYHDVVKTFGSGVTEVRALNGVSLSVHPGEFVPAMAAVGGWAGAGLAGRFRPTSPTRLD